MEVKTQTIRLIFPRKGPASCLTLTSRSRWQSWPGRRGRWGRWWSGRCSLPRRSQERCRNWKKAPFDEDVWLQMIRNLLESVWSAVMTISGISVQRKTPITTTNINVVLWASRWRTCKKNSDLRFFASRLCPVSWLIILKELENICWWIW